MHGVDIRVVRIFNTYGPQMHPYDGRVVSNFILQALKDEDIVPRQFRVRRLRSRSFQAKTW